jgi:hypothetical protein
MAPSFSKISAYSLLAASAALPVQAFWRMPCRGRVEYGRVDPLVDFGKVSAHAHTVHGSGGFSMSATYEDLIGADCTSCGVEEDKSAYWTPSLHFEHEDGTTEMVEQVGGMLSYYLLYGDDVQPFPADFRMIAGDYTRRAFPKGPATSQEVLSAKALGFNCLNYAETPEGSLQRHHMPSKEFMDAQCTDGLRLELMFPSCWNGKDTNMVDNKSHIMYPSEVMDGTCPEGFETRVVSLFYETIWNTYAFAGKKGRFTLSTGDTTGYGYHGDFMMGWDEDFLGQAVKQCTNPSGEISDCPLFTLQDDAKADQCKVSQVGIMEMRTEDCQGPRQGLCGPNPIGGAAVEEAPSTPEATPSPTPTTTPEEPSTTSAPETTSERHHPTHMIVVSGQGAESTPEVDPQPQPATTPKPLVAQQPEELKTLSTTTFTSAGAVYEVVVEQTATTVVTTETATAGINRRHLHHHAHSHHHYHY